MDFCIRKQRTLESLQYEGFQHFFTEMDSVYFFLKTTDLVPLKKIKGNFLFYCLFLQKRCEIHCRKKGKNEKRNRFRHQKNWNFVEFMGFLTFS